MACNKNHSTSFKNSQAIFDNGLRASAFEGYSHITKESIDQLLVQHQLNSGEFEAEDGGLEHQEAITTEMDKDCRYRIGVESVLYSLPKQKMRWIKDWQVTKDSKDVPTPPHPDQEDKFGSLFAS